MIRGCFDHGWLLLLLHSIRAQLKASEDTHKSAPIVRFQVVDDLNHTLRAYSARYRVTRDLQHEVDLTERLDCVVKSPNGCSTWKEGQPRCRMSTHAHRDREDAHRHAFIVANKPCNTTRPYHACRQILSDYFCLMTAGPRSSWALEPPRHEPMVDQRKGTLFR